jgi:hypothetical protein
LEKLFSFYDQIDFDRIRKRISNKKTDDAIDDEEFSLSCLDIPESEEEIRDRSFRTDKRGRRGILRPLRLSRVLGFLEKNFDCEIRQGKGSEIIAYRPGAKIFRFGSHKRNPVVAFERISLALKRLRISRHEWCKAVYG